MTAVALSADIFSDRLTSMELFRALPAPAIDRARAHLSGYWSAGDGGGGDFYWMPASTADDDGGLIIKPDEIDPGDPGRWFRFYVGGLYNLKWWGAVGDYSSHTLSERRPTWTIEDWQAVYPIAVALDDEIDWVALLTALHRTQVYYPNPSGAGDNSRGGTVVAPLGGYMLNRELTPPEGETFWCIRVKSVGPQGFAAVSRDGGATRFIYTGDGGTVGRFADFRTSYYTDMEDITVWYNNPDFAGKVLFDHRWADGIPSDGSYARYRRCTFTGDPSVFGAGEGAKALISLHLSLSGDIQECSFGMAQAHIRFREFPTSGQPYSNKMVCRGNSHQFGKWHHVNIGEATTIEDATVEGLGGYTESFITDDGQRSECLEAVSFDVDAGSQTITLNDASGRTWADYGFVVGMTPFLLDRQNRVNGPNNITCQPITAIDGGGLVMHVPGSGLVDQTNTWGRLQASQVVAGQPGAYCEATPGDTWTFDAATRSVTRVNGRWDEDGWDPAGGNSEMSLAGTSSNDGVFSTASISGDGKTLYFASKGGVSPAAVVDEVVTGPAALAITSGAGPFTVRGCWMGDMFLPGSIWCDFKNPISSATIENNLMVGATRAFRLRSGGTFFRIEANGISSVLEPMTVDPLGGGWSNATIESNSTAMPFLDPEGQACAYNLNMSCNGEYAQDVIDLTMESVTYRSRLTIVGGGVGDMAGFDTAALGLTQGLGGSLGLGSDAEHALIESFGGGGLFLNKLGAGYIHVGRVGSYNAISKTSTPTSPVDCGGCIATPLVTYNVDHAITEREACVGMDSTAALRTATLPSAVTFPNQEHTIVKVDASGNAVNVATVGGQTIGFAAAPYVLSAQGSAVTVKSDGANWYVIGKIP